MAKREQLWAGFADEEYRRDFAEDVATGLAFQIKALREKAGLTQEQLANRIGKQQETISLWENPNYGNYTLKTLKSLASAFDLVPVFRLGSFGELIEWNVNLTAFQLAPPSFDEEDQQRKRGWTHVASGSGWPGITFAADLDLGLHLTVPPTTVAPSSEPPVSSLMPSIKEQKLANAA